LVSIKELYYDAQPTKSQNIYLARQLWISFKHIFINVASSVGIPSSMRTLYKTSLLTEL